MTALGVISLEEAKDNLAIDFPDHDNRIEGIIKAAIALIEQYTGYALYQRETTVVSVGDSTRIVTYPVEIGKVTDVNGNALTIRVDVGVSSIFVWCPPQSTITMLVGFADKNDIPGNLIEACFKVITYLYENKDAYASTLPLDVQLLINQFRRDATV